MTGKTFANSKCSQLPRLNHSRHSRQTPATLDFVSNNYSRTFQQDTRIDSRLELSRSVFICSATAIDVEPEVQQDDFAVKEERRPHSNVLLTFTVPADQCKKAWQKTLKAAAKNLEVPGFRAGKKLPEALIIQQIGKDNLVADAATRVITMCFDGITARYKHNAIGDSLQLLHDHDLSLNFDRNSPFTFQASMDLAPELAWTGDYTKLKVTVEAAGDEETDKEITKRNIYNLLKDKGRLQVVTDRGVQKGDLVIVDFVSRRADDGQVISGSEQKSMKVDTMEEEALFGMKSIVDKLIGRNVGDSIEGRHTLPNTWWEKDSQGADVDCTVDIKEIFTWIVPELTDEIAKDLLPNCSSTEDFWTQMLNFQRAQTRDLTAHTVSQALTEAVAKLVDVDLPESMIMSTAENEYQAQLHELQMNGRMDRESIEKLATPEYLMAFVKSKRNELIEMQKAFLGMEAIFNEQGFQITEEELKKEAGVAMKQAKDYNQQMDEERLMTQVYEVLKADKVLAFLTDAADITINPPPKKAQLST